MVGIALEGNSFFFNVLNYCHFIKEKMTQFSFSKHHHTNTIPRTHQCSGVWLNDHSNKTAYSPFSQDSIIYVSKPIISLYTLEIHDPEVINLSLEAVKVTQ